MQHEFALRSLARPRMCGACGKSCWGIFASIHKCKRCKIVVHESCVATCTAACRKKQPLRIIKGVARVKVLELTNFQSEMDLFAVITIDRQSARTRLSLYEPGITEWAVDDSLVFMIPSKPTAAPTKSSHHSPSYSDSGVKVSGSPTMIVMSGPGTLASRLSTEVARENRMSRAGSSPLPPTMSYQPHLRIDIFSQEYPHAKIVGSAVIDAITSFIHEEEIEVEILSDGKSCGTATLAVSYHPVYSAQQEGILKALTSSRSTIPEDELDSSQSEDEPAAPVEETLLLDHFGFPIPTQYEEDYLARFEYWFQEQLPVQEDFYANNLARSLVDNEWIQSTRELVGYSMAGFPLHHRSELWQRISGSKSRLFANVGVYESILRENISKMTGPIVQIEKDLLRTFVGNPLLESEEMQGKLKRVLVAYSFMDKSTGYCQSLNFVAALLLFLMDEEEAFWFLVVLLEDYLPQYYDKDLLGSKVDTRLFENLVYSHFPELAEKFNFKLGIPLNLKFSSWFLCLFVTQMPIESAMRVLDWMIADGPQVLFSIGLALFDVNAAQLMACEDFEEGFDALTSITERAFNIDLIIKVAASRYRFKREDFDPLRADMRRQKMEEIRTDILRNTDLNEAEFRELVDQFTTHADKKDYVELPAFQKLLAKVFPISSLANTPEVTGNLFNSLDTDKDGVLSMPEFLLACSTMMKGDLDKKAEMWFRVFDHTKDGLLDRTELKNLFCALWSIYGKKLDVSWLDAFLANGATTLDLVGFKRACRRVPLLADWVTLSSRAFFRSDSPTLSPRSDSSSSIPTITTSTPPTSPTTRNTLSVKGAGDDMISLKGLSAPHLFARPGSAGHAKSHVRTNSNQ